MRYDKEAGYGEGDRKCGQSRDDIVRPVDLKRRSASYIPNSGLKWAKAKEIFIMVAGLGFFRSPVLRR
jgi:hypothetical protein